MAKFPKLKINKQKRTKPGSQPGSVNIPLDAIAPVAQCFVYDLENCNEFTAESAKAIEDCYNTLGDKILWVHISGFGNKVFYDELAAFFKLHRLEIEDVFNVYQRPKVDEYDGHLFMVSRLLGMQNDCLVNDQLSLLLGKNYVITIQDKRDDYFDPVRQRIRNGKGYLRHQKADYLAYALLDSAIDFYYPTLEKIGNKLDELEEELLSNPTRESMNKILQIKRELIIFRRTIWPERDKINDIIRSSFEEINESTKVYFRDSYDHCIQMLDIVESYKEVTSSLMDVYLSSVSHRLNQVMKVLTIISTIFIPLTFIVGLYGMNFPNVNHETGEKLPLNMPELYSPYGYVSVIGLMVIIVVAQLYFFYKKGWISFKD